MPLSPRERKKRPPSGRDNLLSVALDWVSSERTCVQSAHLPESDRRHRRRSRPLSAREGPARGPIRLIHGRNASEYPDGAHRCLTPTLSYSDGQPGWVARAPVVDLEHQVPRLVGRELEVLRDADVDP